MNLQQIRWYKKYSFVHLTQLHNKPRVTEAAGGQKTLLGIPNPDPAVVKERERTGGE